MDCDRDKREQDNRQRAVRTRAAATEVVAVMKLRALRKSQRDTSLGMLTRAIETIFISQANAEWLDRP